MNEQQTLTDGAEEDSADESKGRQRSTIAFPYTDYEAAAQLAATLHKNAGHGACSLVQLAAWMDQSVKSSSFRTLISAARLFGLLDSDGTESYRLTTLGTRVVDPAQERAAKAEAFLRVPLFAALFEKYKAGVTPPATALEREIVGLGVGEKQKARARQVFESSADQTGFRAYGANRLVMPAVVVPAPSSSAAPATESTGAGNSCGGGNGGGPSDGLNLDPLLIALLQKIPPQGSAWPKDRRVRWFRTFAMNVSEVYDTEDDPVELNITPL
ncbi:hypothetical protein Acav_1639 [Paracidovorax avenae ATCC 19860]|uniref:Uncharacterized protein n=1 Tax=Paracidovorax avenae (strain ATCC 19860 / DSM 7227 / CCUG 15838 / JCM 20985 / LMG 2117 / NCPPB 1011) TaxID=643561 RepID=F0Q4Q5_PARA1|nr:hypothetical protein [Paracidovorax avenae]ADX45559.1 hypothetical protein Acav_1639 [Paracidovorax avenae ATCC 19860]